MTGTYDASTPPPCPAVDATAPVLEALDRTRSALAALEEREEREEGEPLHPELEAALRAATGPDAPPELRRLGDRVCAGLLTWSQVWLHPHDHGAAGIRLVQCVLRAWAHEMTHAHDALQRPGSEPPRT